LSWALDSRIFGFSNPAGAHIGNVFVHSIVIALLFILILTATENYKTALITSIMALSLAVHVEPVVWAMGRKDVLVACFGLLTMITTIRMLDTNSKLSKILYYFATLFFLVLALFSKISAIVFPLTLMVLAGLRPYLSGNRLPDVSLPWQRILHSVILFIPHLIISFFVYKWYQSILTAYGIMDRGYNATVLQHLRNLIIIDPLVFWRYIQNLFIPYNLSLFYSWPNVTSTFSPYHIALSILTIITGIGLTIFLLVKRKDLLCYLMITAILMVPYLNLVYFGIWIANRYIYFSSFFLLTAIATIAVSLLNSTSKTARIIVTSLLIIFCGFNILSKSSYIKVWKNNETLWTYETGLSNPRPEAFENLGNYYYTAAVKESDQTMRNLYFSKVKETIELARISLGNAPADKPLPILYRMLFLDALINIAQHTPPEKQLAALMKVERLNPGFDSVLWQLTVFYYKEAIKTKDAEQQKKLAYTSLMWYRKYLNVAKNDSMLIKKDHAIRAEYMRDFPFIKDELNTMNTR
jgi:hypothetical protein